MVENEIEVAPMAYRANNLHPRIQSMMAKRELLAMLRHTLSFKGGRRDRA